jgi:dolichol-phosphate mannosyltransferase
VNIAIIIPVYNEAENIAKTLDSLQTGLKQCPASFSVNIVFDRDDDNTLPQVDKISPRYPFPIHKIKNSGVGVCQAIKTGLKESEGDHCLVTMADMSDDYGALPGMVESAQKGADLVCGSRYVKGGKVHGGPVIKKFLSMFAGTSSHFLTGIPTHDITNSYKLYNKKMLGLIEIESANGFELGMEIAVKAWIQGFKITEVPCQWWDRTAGTSRFKLLAWLPSYLRWYFLLLLSRRKADTRPHV